MVAGPGPSKSHRARPAKVLGGPYGCFAPFSRRGGETADAGDLKSSARKGMRVRFPPPAPILPTVCGNNLASEWAVLLAFSNKVLTEFAVWTSLDARALRRPEHVHDCTHPAIKAVGHWKRPVRPQGLQTTRLHPTALYPSGCIRAVRLPWRAAPGG